MHEIYRLKIKGMEKKNPDYGKKKSQNYTSMMLAF